MHTPTPGSLYLAAGAAAWLDKLRDVAPADAERVEDALDGLNQAPGAALNRRRRIRREAGGPLWGIEVPGEDGPLLILWEVDEDGTIVAQYIGSSF